MNWYKKSQVATLPEINRYNWNRFGKQFPGVPWRHVLIMNVGDPTKDEKRYIQRKGLYNKLIDPTDSLQFPDLQVS